MPDIAALTNGVLLRCYDYNDFSWRARNSPELLFHSAAAMTPFTTNLTAIGVIGGAHDLVTDRKRGRELCIVAAAVLDGFIRTESFDPARVLEPARQRFLKQKVKLTSAPELGALAGGKLKRAQAGYLSRVEIETIDGNVLHGAAAPAPGHPKNPFTDGDLAEKLRENCEPFAGAEQTKELERSLFAVEKLASVRELTARLALKGKAPG